MIIRTNGMNANDLQKQINNMTRFKRGFNQTPDDIRNKVNMGKPHNEAPITDPRKKIQALNNLQRRGQ